MNSKVDLCLLWGCAVGETNAVSEAASNGRVMWFDELMCWFSTEDHLDKTIGHTVFELALHHLLQRSLTALSVALRQGSYSSNPLSHYKRGDCQRLMERHELSVLLNLHLFH